MITLRINKILGLLNEILIISVVFFVPIVFSPPFFLTINTFELNKIVLFKILTLAAALVVLFKIIIFKQERKKVFLFVTLYYKYLLIPVIYIFALFLASVFSIDQEKSFFGLYGRQQGFISSSYYFLYFVLLLLYINGKSRFNRIITAIIFSSAIVSVYGVVQRLGLDPIPWSESIDATGRVTSTFGQPNFLGFYLLLTLPVTAYFIIKKRALLIRGLLACILILQVINLIYIYSVSILISFLIALFLFVALYVMFRKKQLISIINKIKPKRSFFLIILILLLILICGISYGISKSSYPVKVKALISLEGSAGTRVLIWGASIDAIKKNPVLGYGPETQGDILVKYYTKDWGVYNYVNARPNRAHNIILDTLLTGGIIGMAALAVLIGFFYRLLYLSIKKHKMSVLPYFIFLSLTGYLLSMLLNFPSITSDIYFWILLALTIYFYAQEKVNSLESHVMPKTWEEKKYNRLLVYLLKLILLLVVIYPVVYIIDRQVKHYISDHYYFSLTTADKEGDYFAVMQYYDDIEELLGVRVKYLKMAAMPISNYLLGITDPHYRRPGEKRTAEVLKTINSDSYSDRLLRAKILAGLTSKENKQYYSEAENEYSEIIKISPEMPSNYMEIARFYLAQEGFDKAILNYEIAMQKLPDIKDSRLNYLKINKIKREAHFGLSGIGDTYMLKKDYAKAVEYYLKAEETYKGNVNIYNRLLKGYYFLDDLERAIYYGEIGYNLEKHNYTWAYLLGELYYYQKDYKNALLFTKFASSLEPKDSGIKGLIRKITADYNEEQ